MNVDKTSPERSVDGSAPESAPTRRRVPYLTANLFAACFGLAGLASAWTALMHLVHGPDWPANALSIVAALVWLITAIAYLGNVGAQHRWNRELSDQTLAPFISLLFIVPVLLSVPLAEQARGAGEVVFGCAAALTVIFGAWITGDWIARNGEIRRWHPGYYLPSAAGGLIAAGASAALGFSTLSHVLFGLGVGSYLLLGSIIGQRLFVVPELPAALLPTIAIELAPPVVAADSWFAINGGRVDTTVAVISGFAVLMLLAQLRLIPLYRTAPFGPAYWAFSFPVAAAVTGGLHWLGAEHVPGATGLGYAVVGVLSAGYLLLTARTVAALTNGTFFLRVPVPAQAGGSLRNRAVISNGPGRLWPFTAPSTRGGPQAGDVAGRPMAAWNDRARSSPVITKDLCTYTTVFLRQEKLIRDHGPAPQTGGIDGASEP
jgi:tellurite resistance protein